jgi:hypothetical protein
MAVNPPASRVIGEGDLADRSGAEEGALIALLIDSREVDSDRPQFRQ